MAIEFTNSVKIYPSPDYHFEVEVTDFNAGFLSYHEDCHDSGARGLMHITHFRNPDEMEAVAKAMLKLAQEAKAQ